MEGSRENPIRIDDSPVKLVITECNLLPREFGQYAQKQLELYCRLHQKEAIIKGKLDRLAVQQNNALYSPVKSGRLSSKSTTGHRILNRIFKQKLHIFDRAYDEGWHTYLPDHIESEDQVPISSPVETPGLLLPPRTQPPELP
jgi:hypothetical protein